MSLTSPSYVIVTVYLRFDRGSVTIMSEEYWQGRAGLCGRPEAGITWPGTEAAAGY